MNWYKFLIKIKPDGKAFRSILFSKIFYEVIAFGINMIQEYSILTINDQVWYVNSNFDPEPWEERYQIMVPEFATLDERRQVVKSYMLFPQSQNRLSRDYIQSTIIDAGFTDIVVEYNSSGDSEGFLRANDISDEKIEFGLGPLTYNSFILSGSISESYYYNAISLVMQLKPLQVAVYDKIDVLNAYAFDDNFALAFDDNFALIIPVL